MTEKNPWANKMWTEIFEEMGQKGDALLDLFDSVCIVRLRQVVEWSLEEMWSIKDYAEITDAIWEDYAELEADVLAAKRMLEYFGASVVESDQ
jgi:Mor family transcriptional regulator